MSTKHTPGPWGRNIKPASKYPIIYAGEAPRHSHVAMVLSKGLTEEEGEGNCNLIAAAPELLAACKAADARLALEKWDHENSTRYVLRAAIAKAEGREP